MLIIFSGFGTFWCDHAKPITFRNVGDLIVLVSIARRALTVGINAKEKMRADKKKSAYHHPLVIAIFFFKYYLSLAPY